MRVLWSVGKLFGLGMLLGRILIVMRWLLLLWIWMILIGVVIELVLCVYMMLLCSVLIGGLRGM